ncbi:hypothetical protein [Halorubrum sp. SD626R]|uniref:hypothetical protein n=1 Tax=Halorubrum sp. SD626R TaxID=1419722 RepID=UPI000A3DE71C|nr:hypothetical protein [Halorubrum sp. SD626R]TKX79387.1 hypothetical protein EXE53_16095 [Halorubrum sp. SD626R]
MSDDTAPADGTSPDDDASPDETSSDDGAFAAELDRVRELLDGDDIEAVHVGVVRDGEVDTTFAQRADGDPEGEGLRALALLAAHVRLVSNQAGVEPSAVAGDAATLAGRVERIPASTDDLPDE